MKTFNSIKKEKHFPLVSICIPTYNGDKYLTETLECAINQTYPNIEIIITDDCSTDNTTSICEFYAKQDRRIKFYQNKTNLGLKGNWCEAIDRTNKDSDWIKFLFQDDLMHTSTVEKMIDCALSTNVNFVLCDREYIFEKEVTSDIRNNYNNIIKTNTIFSKSNKYQPDKTVELIYPYVFHNCLGEPPCMLIKKETFEKNEFDNDLPQLIDYVFALNRIIKEDFYYLNKKLIKFRVHFNSQTSKNTLDKSNKKKFLLKELEINFYEKLKICQLITEKEEFQLIKKRIGAEDLNKIKKFFFYKSYVRISLNKKNITRFYQSTTLNHFIFKNLNDKFIWFKYKILKIKLKKNKTLFKYSLF